jgi:hypothetical protein
MANSICWHLRTSRDTHRKLTLAAKILGVKPSSRGIVLDICIDAIIAHAQTATRAISGKYRVNAASVRAIRRSPNKLLAIAAENGISETLVRKIRKRECYDWVD